MKIGIGYAAYIRTEGHFNFAKETLASITSDEHELVFGGFANNQIPMLWRAELERYGWVADNNENNVSRAWNRAIDTLLREGCEFVFVPNLDIRVKKGSLDDLVRAVAAKPEPLLWTMDNWHYLHAVDNNPGLEEAPLRDHWVPYPHFSAFMVDARLFEVVGPFDENFRPAYNEDIDMHWRIKLAGHDAVKYEGARFYHHGSRTIGEDHVLNAQNVATHAANNRYFAEKWKYKPPTADDPFTADMYRHPFNDPAKVGIEREFMATW